ncbi:hypothetical protein JTB14_025734 [Gonioctena quinquepunctata]|nr:hypothetical protein JTB14_025734 [Gonioctena quinquepunctata]
MTVIYMKILELTNAHRDSRGYLKHGGGKAKYNDLIRPMFLGGGMTDEPMKMFNTKPIEYIYCDDPNELCERLKLLIASINAGNGSHDNEILAIINEFKEANIS